MEITMASTSIGSDKPVSAVICQTIDVAGTASRFILTASDLPSVATTFAAQLYLTFASVPMVANERSHFLRTVFAIALTGVKSQVSRAPVSLDRRARG